MRIAGVNPMTDKVVVTIERVPDPEYGTPKSRGVTSGMGVCRFIALLFELNETLPPTKKLTDTAIKKKILAEFPQCTEKVRSSIRRLVDGTVGVSYYRSLYNAGRLTAGLKPRVRSKRYAMDGSVLEYHNGRPTNDTIQRTEKE